MWTLPLSAEDIKQRFAHLESAIHPRRNDGEFRGKFHGLAGRPRKQANFRLALDTPARQNGSQRSKRELC
jgi:hypothetical protein